MFFFNKLLKTPIATLFYSIVSKWYLLVAGLSMVVLYWVLKGLISAGVMDSAFAAFTNAERQIKGFAQFCTPKIMDINKFIQCLIDTPEYTGDETSRSFENSIKKAVEDVETKSNHSKIYLLSPYDALYDDDESSSS